MRMFRPRSSPDSVDQFDAWDSIRAVRFKNGKKATRYTLNKIPSSLLHYVLPGPGMGYIQQGDIGCRLIIDEDNHHTITAYIE